MTTSADAPRAPRCSAFAERSPRRANLAVPHEIGGFAWISRVTYLAGDVWELVLPAVFKTVCGALLRRPGWVRFPSIPAKFFGCDSQLDSQAADAGGRPRT